MVSTAKYFLPRLLAQFRDEHPGVEVRLRAASNREEVVALMREGAVELAIMGRPPKIWPSRAEPFAMHPHGLVTCVEHPFARAERVPARALLGEGFIVREPGSGTRAALDEFMDAYQITPRVVMHACTPSTTTATPCGLRIRSSVLAISAVSRSWICSRRA